MLALPARLDSPDSWRSLPLLSSTTQWWRSRSGRLCPRRPDKLLENWCAGEREEAAQQQCEFTARQRGLSHLESPSRSGQIFPVQHCYKTHTDDRQHIHKAMTMLLQRRDVATTLSVGNIDVRQDAVCADC